MKFDRQAINLLVVLFGCIVIGSALLGCQSYQPPGQDLWLAL